MRISILILLLGLCAITFAADCNFTHYEFFSRYSLGKQDEANRTFEDIKTLIKIPDVNFTNNESTNFILSDIKHSFFYLDSKQESEIFTKNTIIVHGGRLEARVEFSWSRNNGIFKGTGTALIESDDVGFEKLLQIDEGYLDYKLVEAYDITFRKHNFSLVRLDPPNALPSDRESLEQALSIAKDGFVPVKEELSREISKYFSKYLEQNLKNEHYPLDNHFNYTYTNKYSKQNITLEYNLIPAGIDLEQEGLSMNFVSFIKDYDNWKCGKMIPSHELNPKVYGGIQEFVSFSVFENSARYALEQQFLNTDLNRANWESRFFQFFAGDLYEVIPELQKEYVANEKVRGNCSYVQGQPFEMIKNDTHTLNASVVYSCALEIGSTKISQFEVKISLTIFVEPHSDHFHFDIVEASGQSIFNKVDKFEVTNLELASHMVSHSLNRLKGERIFGSGWKFFPRDYPHVMVEDDYLVIYDSTHVENIQELII